MQTGTLKRASGFKRYSLSFLMERNRKWRCGGVLCDLYAASVEGQKSKSISLSTPLVCSRIIPLCFSHFLFSITEISLHLPFLGNTQGFTLKKTLTFDLLANINISNYKTCGLISYNLLQCFALSLFLLFLISPMMSSLHCHLFICFRSGGHRGIDLGLQLYLQLCWCVISALRLFCLATAFPTL